MNIKELFQHLAGHFRQDHHEELPNEVIERFLRILEDVRLDDMPCSQVYARLDEYVEKEMHGEEAALVMPLLKEHLDLCPDCCEEYETLLKVVEDSSNQP
jgi:hypothetical protein